jgi:hypothetical protein
LVTGEKELPGIIAHAFAVTVLLRVIADFVQGDEQRVIFNPGFSFKRCAADIVDADEHFQGVFPQVEEQRVPLFCKSVFQTD